jgi:hypothetical protein
LKERIQENLSPKKNNSQLCAFVMAIFGGTSNLLPVHPNRHLSTGLALLCLLLKPLVFPAHPDIPINTKESSG